MEHKLRVLEVQELGFQIGDKVTRRSGNLTIPAEVRSIFTTSRNKLMVVLEYKTDIFRVVRPQQIRKV